MPVPKLFRLAASGILLLMTSVLASAADYPTPRQGDWSVPEFTFHDGATLRQMKVHYQTIGDAGGEPVLILHGTGGSSASFLKPQFAGQLFGPGQALDASRYFIILPDAIGAGASWRRRNTARIRASSSRGLAGLAR